MIYRYRNNDPIYRHAELPEKLLGDDDPGPQPSSTPSPPSSGEDVHPFNWSDGIGVGDFEGPVSAPAPKPARALLPSEMPHGDAVRNETLRDALEHMHQRGHIDLFDIMANVLGETDEDEHDHPELRDLHSTAHHVADALHRKEGYE